jgi:predicted O-methyltransferase YrrM
MKTSINFLDQIFSTKKTFNIDGSIIEFNSGINPEEAIKLIQVIKIKKPINTLEIGLAMGSSAVCFLDTKKKYTDSCMHYAIDPNQFKDYEGAGVKIINDHNLFINFKLLEGKTHDVFHYFFENNIVLDMAFIDGWHTFDYTLIDFFLIDQILKPGGVIAFHDMYALSKIKVLKYILSHRDYRIMTEHILFEPNKIKTIKFLLWRIFRNPLLIFSKYFWKFQIKSPFGLIFIEKKSNFEPNFDFYKKF